jgi:hypothetical protein
MNDQDRTAPVSAGGEQPPMRPIEETGRPAGATFQHPQPGAVAPGAPVSYGQPCAVPPPRPASTRLWAPWVAGIGAVALLAAGFGTGYAVGHESSRDPVAFQREMRDRGGHGSGAYGMPGDLEGHGGMTGPERRSGARGDADGDRVRVPRDRGDAWGDRREGAPGGVRPGVVPSPEPSGK